MEQGRPLVEATCVSYTYGAYRAVTDVSLRVGAGELVALIGRNGAGKSTLLRCLAGWDRVTAGEVRLLGLPVERHERQARARAILVPDTPPFYDELSAWEHVQFIAEVHRRADWPAQAERLLRRFGLWSQREALPFAFSRGMRYKLALCMALVVAPPVLLLDEPFGPLDPISADRLWDDLWAYRGEGRGMLLSSHQLPPRAQPDRYLVMEDGAIALQGSPSELRHTLRLDTLSVDTLLRGAVAGATGDA